MTTAGDLTKTAVEEGVYKLRLAEVDTKSIDESTGKDMLTLTWETEGGIRIWDRIVHAVEQVGRTGKVFPTLRLKWAPLYIALGGDPQLDVDPENAQEFFDKVVEMAVDCEYAYAFVSVRKYNGKDTNDIGQYMTQDAAEEAEAIGDDNPFA